MPKKTTKNQLEEEKDAQQQAEAMTSESSEASEAEINIDENAEEGFAVEESTDSNQVTPAEVAAISEDTESAKELNKKAKPAKKVVVKVAPKKTRSAKYLKHVEMVEKGKLYNLEEAIELVKKLSISKYDGSVEIHVRLNAKKAKGSTESSRGIFHLPHGSGKEKKVVVLTEDKIEEIAKTKKIDFDIALASPELMPKVARIAKILGPKGKMPDPKAGTVTTDTDKTIAEINSGKVEYRIDSTNNVHQLIGKVSWSTEKLLENAKAVLGSLPKNRMASVFFTASVAPSVPVDLSVIK